MSNTKKKPNPLSFPSRGRLIYSNSQIGANSKCNCSRVIQRPSMVSTGSNKISNHLNVEADSIGSAVGLTCSTTPIEKLTPDGRGMECSGRPLALDFAIYLKAFALIYVLPEEEWTTENIDKLLLEGEELFQTSSEDDHADGPLQQTKICDIEDKCIRRKFKLEGHSFTLELKPSYLGEEETPMEQRLPHIISNLKSVLQGFFRTAHYCLLLQRAGYLLIWRRRNVFFVMDVKGRCPKDLVSVRNGVAMLICLESINNVVHLISNLSGASPSDKFNIRELAVVRLVTPDGRIFLRDSDHTCVQYKVINQNYAYLTAHLHLSLNPQANLRNRSSLVVGVVAILASKIDPPASWNTNMFDRLISFGVEFCRSHSEDRLSIGLNNFPTQIRLGQFLVELRLAPKVSTGQWLSSISPFKKNNIQTALRRILQTHGNALLQINSQTYALWVKDHFYYLLDPYRHTVATPQRREDGTLSAKWATVRMFRDYRTMFNVFHQLLKESNRQSAFLVHVVQIRNIVECPLGYSIKNMSGDASCEVKSLNETIEFPDHLSTCEKLLANISDYEPDLPSDVEDEPVIVNKFKPLITQNAKTNGKDDCNIATAKSTFSKPTSRDSTRVSTRATSPIGKPIGPNVQKTFVSRHPSVTVKPVSADQSLSVLKATIISLKEKSKSSKRISKQLIHTPKLGSTRRKGVWSVKATNDLSALRNETRAAGGWNQVGIRERTDSNKGEADRKPLANKCDTGSSQTSFVSAKLPLEMHSLETDLVAPPSKGVSYPIYTNYPHIMAVAGSESGTIESLRRLLDYSFKVSNRVLTMTPWGNYVVFRHPKECGKSYLYYLFDGCTCNVDRFRHLDLRYGTAGLIPFDSRSQVICYMIDSRETRALKMLHTSLDDSLQRFDDFIGRGA